MAAHPHAALMAEFAKDAATTEQPWLLWQMKGARGVWYTCRITPNWSPASQYRRKTACILINKTEVPMPLRQEPEVDTVVYLPHILFTGPGDARFIATPWIGNEHDQVLLRRGLVHTTPQAALQHAMALTAATRIAPD